METKVILEKQDLTYLNWTRTRNSSGTAGSFLKAYDDLGKKKLYYKLSNFNSVDGVVGHECVNEIIVDRLLTILGIEHLHYQLVNAKVHIDGENYNTFVSVSEDFKDKRENKLAYDTYYDLLKEPAESPLTFGVRMGWEKYLYEMLVVDFIILNRDRHGANIEVLRNTKRKSIRLAPLFDHGLSLVFNCHNEIELSKYDVLEDKAVQCFIGGRSTLNNLKLIPKDKLPLIPICEEKYKTIIFRDLDTIISDIYRKKTWTMISQRWRYYENLRSER